MYQEGRGRQLVTSQGPKHMLYSTIETAALDLMSTYISISLVTENVARISDTLHRKLSCGSLLPETPIKRSKRQSPSSPYNSLTRFEVFN